MHHRTIPILLCKPELTIMAVALKPEQNPLSVDFCGLKLDSPIVLLSGCVGFGE